MPASSKPKILIVTAGFGEGHNSAAKNLAKALEDKADILLSDPCALGNPILNKKMRQAYQMVITHTPTFWSTLYFGTDKMDLSKQSKLLPSKPEKVLHRILEDFQPDAIVSTFPVYPYYAERSFADLPRIPSFTVVTDSLRINRSWRASPADYFLVTDKHTKDLLSEEIDPSKIYDCGFAVNPTLIDLPKVRADEPIQKLKILYFPTGQKPQVRRVLRAILASDNPNIEITVVLGHNFRKLFSRANEISQQYPGQIKIKGWTKKVPELICNHHLVIGKAGGATSHECIAATTPMLVHYLLPGQEQGNLELLEKIGGGILANSTSKLTIAINKLCKNDFAQWREMKQKLIDYDKADGALKCSEFILNKIK